MPDVPAAQRRRRLSPACSATLASVLLIGGLAGCDPADPAPPPSPPPVSSPTPAASTPAPTPTPTPTPSPSPTSQKEKEEAAIKQAVLDFYEVTNRVRMDPSEDYEQLKKVAAGELLQLQLGDLQEWRGKKWRSTKPVKVKNVTVGEVTAEGDTIQATTTYCVDSTGVDVVNADGESQVDRSTNLFSTVAQLRKKGSGPWLPYRERDGANACGI